MNKTEEAVKLVKIASFLEEYKIKNATINEDLTVDVDGNVTLWSKGLLEIPIQFGRVEGDFRCNDNNLISLKGCPKYVGGIFNCGNNQLTSLKGCPKEVERSFYCYINQLKSLKGAPKKVEGEFWCDENQLENLIGSPEYVGGEFNCNNNPLLKSLKGIGMVHGKIYSDFFEGILEDYKGK